jgi:hypothetical protein
MKVDPIIINLAHPVDPLGLFPNSIYLHISTIRNTVRAWIPFRCLAKVLCFLDDAAIPAAIKFPDPRGRIISVPA